MRYLSIILLFFSLSLILVGQDLEESFDTKTTPSTKTAEIDLEPLEEDWFAEDDSDAEATITPIAGGTAGQKVDLEERDPSTYRKEEYLNSLLRQMYYQKISTQAWSKYLHHDSWTANVKRHRYLAQLKNYITSNDKDIIILRDTPKRSVIRPEVAITEPVEPVETSPTIMVDDVSDSIEDVPLEETVVAAVADAADAVTVDSSSEEVAEPEVFVERSITFLDVTADSTACTAEQIAEFEAAIAQQEKEKEEAAERQREKEKQEAAERLAKLEEETNRNTTASATTTKPEIEQPAEVEKDPVQTPRPPVKEPVHPVAVQTSAPTATPPRASKVVTTPPTTTLKASNLTFAQRKGSLPWPVRGRVTDRFGMRQNAEARGLRPENYGVDMLCPPGTIAKAVHQGTVLMSKRQSPYDIIVTVKHEDYTTAYYYLITSYVKPGDRILPGQPIGQLRTSVQEADFHFEIWQNQDRVNPESWLKRK